MKWDRFITFIVILCLLCQNVTWAHGQDKPRPFGILKGQDKLAKDTECDNPRLRAAARAFAEMLEEARRKGHVDIPPHLDAEGAITRAIETGEIPRETGEQILKVLQGQGLDGLRRWYKENRGRLTDATRLVFSRIFGDDKTPISKPVKGKNPKKERGFGLVEILIGIPVILLLASISYFWPVFSVGLGVFGAVCIAYLLLRRIEGFRTDKELLRLISDRQFRLVMTTRRSEYKVYENNREVGRFEVRYEKGVPVEARLILGKKKKDREEHRLTKEEIDKHLLNKFLSRRRFVRNAAILALGGAALGGIAGRLIRYATEVRFSEPKGEITPLKKRIIDELKDFAVRIEDRQSREYAVSLVNLFIENGEVIESPEDIHGLGMDNVLMKYFRLDNTVYINYQLYILTKFNPVLIQGTMVHEGEHVTRYRAGGRLYEKYPSLEKAWAHLWEVKGAPWSLTIDDLVERDGNWKRFPDGDFYTYQLILFEVYRMLSVEASAYIAEYNFYRSVLWRYNGDIREYIKGFRPDKNMDSLINAFMMVAQRGMADRIRPEHLEILKREGQIPSYITWEGLIEYLGKQYLSLLLENFFAGAIRDDGSIDEDKLKRNYFLKVAQRIGDPKQRMLLDAVLFIEQKRGATGTERFLDWLKTGVFVDEKGNRTNLLDLDLSLTKHGSLWKGVPIAFGIVGQGDADKKTQNIQKLERLKDMVLEKVREAGGKRPVVLRILGAADTGKSQFANALRDGLNGILGGKVFTYDDPDIPRLTPAGLLNRQGILAEHPGAKLIIATGLLGVQAFRDEDVDINVLLEADVDTIRQNCRKKLGLMPKNMLEASLEAEGLLRGLGRKATFEELVEGLLEEGDLDIEMSAPGVRKDFIFDMSRDKRPSSDEIRSVFRVESELAGEAKRIRGLVSEANQDNPSAQEELLVFVARRYIDGQTGDEAFRLAEEYFRDLGKGEFLSEIYRTVDVLKDVSRVVQERYPFSECWDLPSVRDMRLGIGVARTGQGVIQVLQCRPTRFECSNCVYVKDLLNERGVDAKVMDVKVPCVCLCGDFEVRESETIHVVNLIEIIDPNPTGKLPSLKIVMGITPLDSVHGIYPFNILNGTAYEDIVMRGGEKTPGDEQEVKALLSQHVVHIYKLFGYMGYEDIRIFSTIAVERRENGYAIFSRANVARGEGAKTIELPAIGIGIWIPDDKLPLIGNEIENLLCGDTGLSNLEGQEIELLRKWKERGWIEFGGKKTAEGMTPELESALVQGTNIVLRDTFKFIYKLWQFHRGAASGNPGVTTPGMWPFLRPLYKLITARFGRVVGQVFSPAIIESGLLWGVSLFLSSVFGLPILALAGLFQLAWHILHGRGAFETSKVIITVLSGIVLAVFYNLGFSNAAFLLIGLILPHIIVNFLVEEMKGFTPGQRRVIEEETKVVLKILRPDLEEEEIDRIAGAAAGDFRTLSFFNMLRVKQIYKIAIMISLPIFAIVSLLLNLLLNLGFAAAMLDIVSSVAVFILINVIYYMRNIHGLSAKTLPRNRNLILVNPNLDSAFFKHIVDHELVHYYKDKGYIKEDLIAETVALSLNIDPDNVVFHDSDTEENVRRGVETVARGSSPAEAARQVMEYIRERYPQSLLRRLIPHTEDRAIGEFLLGMVWGLAHATGEPGDDIEYLRLIANGRDLTRAGGQGGVNETGCLDGCTILRFSHSYDSVGGLQIHLQQLNRALLERNNVTIIQMYITHDESDATVTEERIGKGRLIRVPILVTSKDRQVVELRVYDKLKDWLARMGIKDILRDWLYSTRLSVLLSRVPIIREFYNRRFTGKIDEIRRKAGEIFDRYRVDLVMLHSLYLQDSLELAAMAKEREIPVLAQNHGENSFFNSLMARRFVPMADGIAGVSNAGVPGRIQSRFVNLSDGIDTDFFRQDLAKPLDLGFNEAVVLLPARIGLYKGSLDLVEIARILRDKGIRVKIIFAGPVDSNGSREDILHLAQRYGLTDSIIFTGPLSQEELRDYYAISDVVVLPSRSEGLGRVLLEAQAMGRPVVAYNVGGIPEAMIDGRTGFLVRKGDLAGFSERLGGLLLDRDKRESMGREGRRFIGERFSLKALAERHEEFYTGILGTTKSTEMASSGCIMKGIHAWLEFERRRNRIKENDITSSYKKRIIGLLEGILDNKEIYLFDRDRRKLRNQLRNIRERKTRIYGFNSIVKDTYDFVLGRNYLEDRELFIAEDVVAELRSRGPPTLVDEYLLHEILCPILGHKQSILIQQAIFPQHYPDKKKLQKQDPNDPYKGLLGVALRDIINRKVSERKQAVLTGRHIYLTGRYQFHLPHELVGRVIVETDEKREWVRLEDKDKLGNWLEVSKRGEGFFISIPGHEERLVVDKRCVGLVYNDIMAEFVDRVIQSGYNPRNRAKAIKEYLVKEGIKKPGYKEVDMGSIRVILGEFYDENRDAISIYRDRGMAGRYAAIVDNRDPENYIVLERRGDSVCLIVRNRVVKLYPENNFIYLARIPEFKKFDLRIPRPVKAEKVRRSGSAALGHTTFSFYAGEPILVERREGATHRDEEWTRDKITFKNPDSGEVIAEIQRVGIDRFTLTGFAARGGSPVTLVGNHLYLNKLIWSFPDMADDTLKEYFTEPKYDRRDMPSYRLFADDIIIRAGYPYTDIALDAEARYDLYTDLCEDGPAVAPLSDREKEVLRLRLGSDIKAGLTLEEIARAFSITRAGVKQIETRAIRKWRRTAAGNSAIATSGMYTPEQHRKMDERIRNVVSGLAGLRVQDVRPEVWAGLDGEIQRALEDVVLYLLPPEDPQYPYYLRVEVIDGKLEYQIAHAGSFGGRGRFVYMTRQAFMELPADLVGRILRREARLARARFEAREREEEPLGSQYDGEVKGILDEIGKVFRKKNGKDVPSWVEVFSKHNPDLKPPRFNNKKVCFEWIRENQPRYLGPDGNPMGIHRWLEYLYWSSCIVDKRGKSISQSKLLRWIFELGAYNYALDYKDMIGEEIKLAFNKLPRCIQLEPRYKRIVIPQIVRRMNRPRFISRRCLHKTVSREYLPRILYWAFKYYGHRLVKKLRSEIESQPIPDFTKHVDEEIRQGKFDPFTYRQGRSGYVTATRGQRIVIKTLLDAVKHGSDLALEKLMEVYKVQLHREALKGRELFKFLLERIVGVDYEIPDLKEIARLVFLELVSRWNSLAETEQGVCSRSFMNYFLKEFSRTFLGEIVEQLGIPLGQLKLEEMRRIIYQEAGDCPLENLSDEKVGIIRKKLREIIPGFERIVENIRESVTLSGEADNTVDRLLIDEDTLSQIVKRHVFSLGETIDKIKHRIIRDKLRYILRYFLEHGHAISIPQLAKDLGVSPQRISQVLGDEDTAISYGYLKRIGSGLRRELYDNPVTGLVFPEETYRCLERLIERDKSPKDVSCLLNAAVATAGMPAPEQPDSRDYPPGGRGSKRFDELKFDLNGVVIKSGNYSRLVRLCKDYVSESISEENLRKELRRCMDRYVLDLETVKMFLIESLIEALGIIKAHPDKRILVSLLFGEIFGNPDNKGRDILIRIATNLPRNSSRYYRNGKVIVVFNYGFISALMQYPKQGKAHWLFTERLFHELCHKNPSEKLDRIDEEARVILDCDLVLYEKIGQNLIKEKDLKGIKHLLRSRRYFRFLQYLLSAASDTRRNAVQRYLRGRFRMHRRDPRGMTRHMQLLIREDLVDSEGNRLWREKEWTAEELLQREPDSTVTVDSAGNVVFDTAFKDRIKQEFGLDEDGLGYVMAMISNIFRLRKRRYFPRYYKFPRQAIKFYFVNESQAVAGDCVDNNVAFINLKAIKELKMNYSFLGLWLGVFLSHEILGHEMGIDSESLLTQQDAELFARKEFPIVLIYLYQNLVRVFKPDSLFIVEFKRLIEVFHFLERIGVKKGDRLVHVGGALNNTTAIATGYMGGHYVGYEINEIVWTVFDDSFWERDRSREFGGSIEQIQGEFSYGSSDSSNLSDHSVDHVLMFGVLFDTTTRSVDKVKTFKEALRVVKNGGKIVAGSYGWSWYMEAPEHQRVIEEALGDPAWKGRIRLKVVGRGNYDGKWYIEYMVEFLDEAMDRGISHVYERLNTRYRELVSKDLWISIISSGRLPGEWPKLAEFVNAGNAEIVASIGRAVEDAAKGTELTTEAKALIIEAISVQFFVDRDKTIERIRKDLCDIGYGAWLDEIIKKFVEITGREASGGVSHVDYNFILELERLLGYPRWSISFKVNAAEMERDIDRRIENFRKSFESNLKQWKVLDSARGKMPTGVIVQDIKDLGPGVENWKEGLERYNIDARGVEMVYIVTEEDRRRLSGVRPPNVRLVNSLEEVEGENIVYLASKDALDKVKRQGVTFVERGYAGPVLELNLCLLLLGSSDVEGTHRMFLDKLEEEDIISGYEKDMFLREVSSSGYIRLPKIEKVLQMWNELQKDITYLDVWA